MWVSVSVSVSVRVRVTVCRFRVSIYVFLRSWLGSGLAVMVGVDPISWSQKYA